MFSLSLWLYSQSLPMFRGWSVITEGLSTAFGLPTGVTMSLSGGLAAVVRAPFPVFPMQVSIGIVLTMAVLCIAASYVVAPTRVPLRYSLRMVAAVLALPALGYVLADNPAQFDLEAHLAQVFKMGYWFLLIAPVVYGVTGFILPGNLARRLGIVIMACLFLYVTVPVLALLHLHAVLLAGPALVPALNVFFTILVMSFELIAFYGLLAAVD